MYRLRSRGYKLDDQRPPQGAQQRMFPQRQQISNAGGFISPQAAHRAVSGEEGICSNSTTIRRARSSSAASMIQISG